MMLAIPTNIFLTQRVVDRVQPQAKEFTVYHKSIPGFGMRVRPSGHKSFILLYKLSGRGGKYLIGNAAAMSLDKAQDKAVEILQKIRDGEDPTAEKRQNTSLLFGAVFKEYMQDWGSNFTPKWRKESEQIFHKYVEGLLGKTPISAVSRRDLLHCINAGSSIHIKRHIRVVLSSFYSWCVDME